MANDVSADQKIRIGMAVVITVAWTISFLVDIKVDTYDPPASIHPLMMIVAGAVFGEGLVRSAVKQIIQNQQGGNGSQPTPPTNQEGIKT